MPTVLDRPYREDELRYLWRAGAKGSFELAVAHNKTFAPGAEDSLPARSNSSDVDRGLRPVSLGSL